MSMSAAEVLERLESKSVSIDAMAERAGDSRGWQSLRTFIGQLQFDADQDKERPQANEQIPDLTLDIGFSLIQILGGGIFALACLLAFHAAAMDISIPTETGRQINNLGLMNDRVVKMVAAGFSGLIGVMMMLLGGKEAKVAQ